MGRIYIYSYKKERLYLCSDLPNQWYEIRIRVEKGITTYSVNDEELFRYTLAGSEGDGHFGLRLLQNHVLFTDFRATIL